MRRNWNTVLPFHEGKACDAVIQHLERRLGAPRTNLRSPDREHDPDGPVELTFTIGDQLFALEHTGIEPYENHIRGNVMIQRFMNPVVAAFKGRLDPQTLLLLCVPWDAVLERSAKETRDIQAALVDWIEVTIAGGLPLISKRDRRRTKLTRARAPGVPFDVWFMLCDNYLGEDGVAFTLMRTGDIEPSRAARIKRACDKKFPKLHHWKKRHGARTVLVLEESDVAMTNHLLVIDAMPSGLMAQVDRPDEIYLLSTATNYWVLMPLLIDGDASPFWSAATKENVFWPVDVDRLNDVLANL